MAKNYPRLDYAAFGVDLLETFDLDPIYPMLAMSGIGDDMMKRWLLAYWCYYSAGVASYIAEQGSRRFYQAMSDGLSTYPRGHERRHFRGAAAVRSLDNLKSYGLPEKVVDCMTAYSDFESVSAAAQTFTGFGPWISWKIADMAERVLQQPVDFSKANLAMYKDPVHGAALVRYGDEHHAITSAELDDVVNQSLVTFIQWNAPPYLDRELNVQEIETILCKWKAHMKGFYPLGNDSFDIAHGLHGWGDLAQAMFYHLKQSTTYNIGEWEP